MSTVLPSSDGKDDPGEPLAGQDELLEYFRGGEKPYDAFRIGTEHEKFGFLREDKQPLPYYGDRGIEAILDSMASEFAWTRIREGDHIIALAREGATVSLEPGGQLELSGAPLRTIHETCNEVGQHLEMLRRVCAPLNVGFIGLGFHPTAKWEDMPTVPKGRYGIMERYMPTRGTRGRDMMKRTCTIQANFDYSSEADMVKSFRTALVVAPLATALFANSPFIDGKPTGAVSERMRTWADTDPDRSGFLQLALDDGFGYERWLDWVLDVPMYFIRRDGVHHDYAGASFRTFMTDGLDGYRATLRDFEDHLTAVFPEVRVKRFMEVRSADGGPWSRICALPALYKGLLYDERARDEAFALMGDVTADELAALQQDVAVRGFAAELRGEEIHERCAALLDVARGGLERIAERDDIRPETGFLRRLQKVVDRKQTFAERLVQRYREEWDGSLAPLWDHLEFFPEVDESPVRE